MATSSFNKMEKPAKFEMTSLASVAVSQRVSDRSSASSMIPCEPVAPITKQTRLLEERSSTLSVSSSGKGKVAIGTERVSSDRFSQDKRPVDSAPALGQLGVDTTRSQRLFASADASVVSAISDISRTSPDRLKEKAMVARQSKVPTVAAEEKRVYLSEAMRDRAKMKQTAAVFKRMDMSRHIRKGDFKDTTQRTPVLIPLHKVLAVDPPEEEMVSYSAVRDVYHQKTKYANKVTGFSREKYVPLFARTTLVEKNGVTPGVYRHAAASIYMLVWYTFDHVHVMSVFSCRGRSAIPRYG